MRALEHDVGTFRLSGQLWIVLLLPLRAGRVPILFQPYELLDHLRRLPQGLPHDG